MVPPEPFGDVPGDRKCSATHPTAEVVALRHWDHCNYATNCDEQLDRSLPFDEIFKAANWGAGLHSSS